jgi:hypothetical protein
MPNKPMTNTTNSRKQQTEIPKTPTPGIGMSATERGLSGSEDNCLFDALAKFFIKLGLPLPKLPGLPVLPPVPAG